MKLLQSFCIIAMVPAAFNVAPASANGRIMAALCTGDGITRSISIPIQRGIPSNDPPGCCVKGCHSSSRKRGCCDGDSLEN